MVERDLSLGQVIKVDFVPHHDSLCNNDFHNCPDKNLTPSQAGAKFIAELISRDIRPNWPIHAIFEDGQLSFDWRSAYHEIQVGTDHHRYSEEGGVRRGTNLSRVLSRAYFSAFAKNRVIEMGSVASMFETKQELENSLREHFFDVFGLSERTAPRLVTW